MSRSVCLSVCLGLRLCLCLFLFVPVLLYFYVSVLLCFSFPAWFCVPVFLWLCVFAFLCFCVFVSVLVCLCDESPFDCRAWPFPSPSAKVTKRMKRWTVKYGAGTSLASIVRFFLVHTFQLKLVAELWTCYFFDLSFVFSFLSLATAGPSSTCPKNVLVAKVCLSRTLAH